MGFVPQLKQSLTSPAGGDCTPTVCTLVGGSNVGTNCDADFNGDFDNTCVLRAHCDVTQQYNGGCGAAGQCEQKIPLAHSTTNTGIILGSGFSGPTGKVVLPGTSAVCQDVPGWDDPVESSTTGCEEWVGYDCNNVFAGWSSPSVVLQNCPATCGLCASSPQLAVPAVAGYPSAWYLVACWIPAGAVKSLPSNVQQLDDLLTVIKEPTDALVWSWFQNEVAELKFTQPQMGSLADGNLAAGRNGDIIVLQRSNCDDVHSITPSTFSFTAGHSAKIVLGEAGNVVLGDEKGGTARERAVAIGKVNELTPGIYKICYATAGSSGESQEDFTSLARELEIKPTPATQPRLSVPRSVILGQDVVVAWASNIGLQTNYSVDSSWLGLYPAGACADTHDCYIAFQFIAANTQTGTVIFSQRDYKISGEYEVRYFDGASRNGQGVVCAGQAGVPSETYLNCGLRVKHTSERINVLGQDIDNTEDLSLTPGLEAVFGTGNRGRYHRTKLT